MAAATTTTSRPQAPDSKEPSTGGYDYSVGTSIPANMPHAVSVSLPKWQDNVDYEEGKLTDVMEIGYPRFFINKTIQKVRDAASGWDVRKWDNTDIQTFLYSPAQLASVLLKKFGTPGTPGQQEPESCLLCPSARIADRCRSFMRAQYTKANAADNADASAAAAPLPVRVVQFSLVSPKAAAAATSQASSAADEPSLSAAPVQLYIVLFPASAFPFAKAYWQHTGDGISSRLADHCLSILEEMGRLGETTPPGSGSRTPRSQSAQRGAGGEDCDGGAAAADPPATEESTATAAAAAVATPSTAEPVHRRYSKNRHYSRGSSANGSVLGALSASTPAASTPTASLPALRAVQDAADPDAEMISSEMSTYVEERYGRNLPASSAPLAKRALRRRIAGTLLSDRRPPPNPNPQGQQSAEYEVGDTARQGTSLSEDDVFLFPTGMSSIFHAHQTALRWRRAADGSASVGKSVCFGFPYTDTLKILQKWGPGCHFYGNGQDADLDDLEVLLKAQKSGNEPNTPPILSLFCEFPSNPLLRCPDLARIRRLADEYDFLVVVDETIGNFLNVEVLPYADLVVSSLTKVFSGDANVMGGSMVVNPKGRHAAAIRRVLADEYEDVYWGIDAVFMERNSRDFATRVERIDKNAEALADRLVHHQQQHNTSTNTPIIKGVYYPKYTTREHYDACRRSTNLLSKDASHRKEGGYGGLFSIIFTTLKAAQTFYDALDCAKGPSLGTNFTLASPYTLLAHYTELDWAKQFGVEHTLVRVSTGLEDTNELVAMFERALRVAGEAVLEE